jgi:archaellum biogenesis ATPase FlaH
MGEGKLGDVFEDEHRALVKVDEDAFFDVNVALVRQATEEEAAIIYVATKKPYLMLKKKLQDAGVSLRSIHFIDGVIETATNLEIPKEEDVLYLDRRSDLNNISTAVFTKAHAVAADEAVLVIDSLKALLASHSAAQVADFITGIQERLETTEMNLVLFDEGRDVEELVGEEIYDVVDTVIFLRGDG